MASVQDKDKAAGRPKGDHHRYVLTLTTGEQLYTRVSHGCYHDPALWSYVLRDQLRVPRLVRRDRRLLLEGQPDLVQPFQQHGADALRDSEALRHVAVRR